MKIINIKDDSDKHKLIEFGFTIATINGVEILKDAGNYVGILSESRLLLTDNELGYFILQDLVDSLGK